MAFGFIKQNLEIRAGAAETLDAELVVIGSTGPRAKIEKEWIR